MWQMYFGTYKVVCEKMMSCIFSSCKTNIGDLCSRCVHPVIIEMIVERQGQGTAYHHSTG